ALSRQYAMSFSRSVMSTPSNLSIFLIWFSPIVSRLTVAHKTAELGYSLLFAALRRKPPFLLGKKMRRCFTEFAKFIPLPKVVRAREPVGSWSLHGKSTPASFHPVSEGGQRAV